MFAKRKDQKMSFAERRTEDASVNKTLVGISAIVVAMDITITLYVIKVT